MTLPRSFERTNPVRSDTRRGYSGLGVVELVLRPRSCRGFPVKTYSSGPSGSARRLADGWINPLPRPLAPQRDFLRALQGGRYALG
jgi:hypothetical protein